MISVIIKKLKLISLSFMTMCGAFYLPTPQISLLSHLFLLQGSLSSTLENSFQGSRTLFMNTFPNWRWFKSQKFRQISSTFHVGKILTNKEENIPAHGRVGQGVSCYNLMMIYWLCVPVWGSSRSACLLRWQMTSQTLVPRVSASCITNETS